MNKEHLAVRMLQRYYDDGYVDAQFVKKHLTKWREKGLCLKAGIVWHD